jgi:RNA polymerase sigma-70 factor (ECF subfamily)
MVEDALELGTAMIDLDGCCRGDRAAWDAFVDRAAPILYSAVRRTLQRYGVAARPDAVQDRTQDVFLRLVRNDFRLLRSYDPGRASLSTWLTLVARSTTIDHLRRLDVPALPLEAADGATAPTAPDAAQPALTALDVPPDLLSPRQNLVIRLLFDDGLSTEEAAETLGVVPQTIRSTKHKAITRLREFFQDSQDARGDESHNAHVEQDEDQR